MNIKQYGLVCFLVSSTLLTSHAMADEVIVNGGFEATGIDEYDIQGWNVAEAGAFGSVLLENDGITNVSGRNNVGAAAGVNYALLDAYTLSNQALYQTFTTGAVSSATLSFSMFVNNQSANGTQIRDAGTGAALLDYQTGGSFDPNQHVRVEILNAGAGTFSTATSDIAQTFYVGGSNGSSVIGGDVANPYVNYTFNVSALLATGGTYTLRFASVANEGQLQLGIDNVSLQITPVLTPVPEADTYAMLLAGLGLIGFATRRESKHRKSI